MADTFAKANARYERNFRKYGTGSAPARGKAAKSRGGSMARGTSTYSRASQFAIAGAAAAARKNKPVTLYFNKRSGLYESTSESRR